MSVIKIQSAKDLENMAREGAEQHRQYTRWVTVCGGTGCAASGCRSVLEALRARLKECRLEKKVKLTVTGCHGFCEQGPLMVIEPANIFYSRVKDKDVGEIIERTLLGDEVIDRLLYTHPATGKKVTCEKDIPFYKVQDRVLLGQNQAVDPCDIRAYIAIGGYSGLVKVFRSMSPEDVIEEIRKSGLRGRGGGGFPTARKWASCRAAEGNPKYVVCNADEGDPGAYMDRSVLEGNPHAVIEGMMIGAYAIGADRGYIYVRNEYPLAVEHSHVAIRQAEELGLLGKNILGSKFSFELKVARGGGAFVCGESSALMASLEGKVGEPRPKDIHTTEKGLFGKPTNLNNVETWANVPTIINRGSKWFADKGTEHSKGTKIFALTGKIRNTGLVEVPMGISLRQIIYDVGGGPVDGKRIKAVQTGGPSGGCLPEEKFDLPVDFEALTQAGSMMGSGSMVVMDESTCMVDVAKYFLKFLIDESCGKCVPCRIGLSRMLEIITDITEGRGSAEKLQLLRETAETISMASLCALGKTAPNPVLSTLEYFFREYEAHVKEHRCPAGVCRELIGYRIVTERCKGCQLCVKACPHEAILTESNGKGKTCSIIAEKCQKCGICRDVCNLDAICVN